MNNRNLCAGMLLLSSAAAHADADTWRFTYTGFYKLEEQAFDPASVLIGDITGKDLNNDSIIDKSELTSLKILDIDYVSCPFQYPVHYSCSIDRFSFSPASGLLDFSVNESDYDENGGFNESTQITTGDAVAHGAWFPHSHYGLDWHRYWTAATTLAIQSPVPEPGQYAMLGAGLLGVAGLRARARRRRMN